MTAFDHKDFKLNEQQEAVLWVMRHKEGVVKEANYFDEADRPDSVWFTAYDLHRQLGFSKSGKSVVIGDAGRRMRELREGDPKKGIPPLLESRKRGRFEEYRLVHSGTEAESHIASARKMEDTLRTVHSREEAYDLEDKGWTLVERKTEGGFFTATLTR